VRTFDAVHDSGLLSFLQGARAAAGAREIDFGGVFIPIDSFMPLRKKGFYYESNQYG
jgi:hypothetical protein